MQHSLAGSNVKVPKEAFEKLNRTCMSKFTRKLAVLVFTKEVLAVSTIAGMRGKKKLDGAKVAAMTGM